MCIADQGTWGLTLDDRLSKKGPVIIYCCRPPVDPTTKSLDALLIRKALDELRIKVIAVKSRKFVRKVREDFALGKGEAEAIVLALAEKAQVLGIDDKPPCRLL